MHGRKPVSTGVLAATLATAALLGGCRDKATTGPSGAQSKDFAAALRSVSGDQQIGPVGAALTQQLAVKVVDAGGLPVEGATVTFLVRSGGGNVNPPSNVSAANGLIYAVWTLGTALGPNTVVAILSNNFVLDSATFSATATSGPPSTLTLVSGNNQAGSAGHMLAAPLVVKVADQFGFVKSGVHVTWTPGAFSGTIAPNSDTTGADGTVSAAWTLGTIVTPQTASASVTGVTSPVFFNANTQADTGRQVVPAGGSGQTAPVSASLPQPLKVKVTDEFGNAIAGADVSWTDSIAGGGTVSVATNKTGADGVAQVIWTLGNRAGPQFLRAKAVASGVTLGFTANATVAFSSVLAGVYSACGVAAANNHVYCWGLNDAGQLGKGQFLSTAAPTTAVSSSSDSSANAPFVVARQLSGGRSSYCALTTAQELYCWGRRWGGQSTSNTAQLQTISQANAQPIALDFIAIGEDHACVMDLAGLTFCTGVNLEGQLGDGTRNAPNANTYVFVITSPTPNDKLSVVSAGSSHNCAMPRYNPADPFSQTPWCWGLNNNGQDGTGGFLDGIPPARVTMTTVPGAAFDSASLSAGVGHTCAMTPAGAGYCWGLNSHGQLGKGAAVSQASRDSLPQPVAGGLTFAKMYAGKYHTCGIDITGAAWCWGRNDYGQLGDGNRTNFNTGNPNPVAVAGGMVFRSLSLGELYTCGVVAPLGSPTGPSAQAGTIYCWGDNSQGQIGNGQASGGNAPLLTPTPVAFQP